MNLTAIFALLDKRERKQLIFVFLAFLFMGAVELTGVGSLGPFIAVASNPDIIHSNKYLSFIYEYLHFSSDISFIMFCGVGVITVVIVSRLALAGVNFIIYYFSAKRRHSIAVRLLEKYLRQPYAFYLRINSSTLAIRILNETAGYVSQILMQTLMLISSAIISLLLIVFLVILNPLFALLGTLVLGLPYLFIFTCIKNYIGRLGGESAPLNVLIAKYIYETFGGIKDIKILGKERVFLNLFKKASLKAAKLQMINELAGDTPRFIIEVFAISGIILLMMFLIRSGKVMDQFLPVITVFAFGIYRLMPLMQKIYRAVTSIKFALPVMQHLDDDLNKLPEGLPLPNLETPRLLFSRSIRLERITFSYPGIERDIVNDQSLTIKHNTSIALVGPTGCGKTTLVDVILGLLKPQRGRMFADDTEITDANIKNWQQNFGYVPQHIYLTDDTIRNNIAFGIDPDKINDEAVVNAAKLANIHDFVTGELRDGYNTIIGERGVRLSGGQRQRIGIARATYHDPSVLILDEATSALDSMTESAIMDAINNMNSKKTIIMIAHRLTTVKNCTTIYMMNQGKFIDSGSYEDLYSRNEVFRQLADGK